MEDPYTESLLQDLKNPDETIREQATQALWQIWFEQKGMVGLEMLRRSQLMLEAGQIDQAEFILNELIRDLPDFAEAWNRRAVLYYTTGQYRKAIANCEKTLELVPFHFGALHGLGLCHAALGEFTAAIQAFRRALDVQPYALVNQRLILECTAKLS